MAIFLLFKKEVSWDELEETEDERSVVANRIFLFLSLIGVDGVDDFRMLF